MSGFGSGFGSGVDIPVGVTLRIYADPALNVNKKPPIAPPPGFARQLPGDDVGYTIVGNPLTREFPVVSDTSNTPTAALLDGATVRTEVCLPMRLLDGRDVEAQVYTFHGLADGKEHIALKFGKPGAAPLVRLHSECLTGDVFGSLRCDCGPQLHEALRLLNNEGGYLLYLRQEGRGIGLYSKLDAYRLQEQGRDTYAADRELGHGTDARDYTAAAQMLRALGLQRIELLSNNPDKSSQLEQHGIQVASRLTGVHANPHNVGYLRAKATQTHHVLATILPNFPVGAS